MSIASLEFPDTIWRLCHHGRDDPAEGFVLPNTNAAAHKWGCAAPRHSQLRTGALTAHPCCDAGRGAELSLLSPLAPCVTHCPAPLGHTSQLLPRGKALRPPPSISGSFHCLTTVHYAQPIIAALSLPVLLDSSKNIGLAGAAPCRGSGKATGAGAGRRGLQDAPSRGDKRGELLFPIWPLLP